MFDLLIRNGHLIDPGSGRSGQHDIAVRDGRIVAVEPSLPGAEALEVVDATGRVVTPGLIDLHTHIYDQATFFGLAPDPVAARTGVTTWVDAGSAGAFNLAGLRHHVADRVAVRVFAFMNIAAIGLVPQDFELADLRWCSADLLVDVARRHPDFVVGVKYRAGRAGGAADLEPLLRARRAATELGQPLMVHISRTPPTLDEVLEQMGPGDVLTHAFTNLDMKILDDGGRLLPAARRARDAGVLLDVGHGSGSFSWESAEALAELGIMPDTISSDIHQVAIYGPHRRGMHTTDEALGPFGSGNDAAGMVFTYDEEGERSFSLLDCMGKFLHLGMSLDDVVRAVTATPARIIRQEDQIGALRLGMRADLAVLDLVDGDRELVDSKGLARSARTTIRCEATIVDGRALEPREEAEPAPWVVAVPHQG